MAKPATPATASLNLIQFNNLDWNSRLLIPDSLLTKFAELMSLCTVIKAADRGLNKTNANVYYPIEGVDYGTRKFGTCVLAADKEEAEQFTAFHNAHVELLCSDVEYTAAPHTTLDEFRVSARNAED